MRPRWTALEEERLQPGVELRVGRFDADVVLAPSVEGKGEIEDGPGRPGARGRRRLEHEAVRLSASVWRAMIAGTGGE